MNKKCIIQVLQWMTVAFLLWMTILPVEVRWAEADGILCRALPVLGVIGGVIVLSAKGGGKLTIVDGLCGIWAIYYIARAWIGSEYPCGTEWLQTVEMMALFCILRMVFHHTKVQACWLCAGIVLLACCEALLGTGQLISGTGRHHLFVLTGTFQNPGPYSAYLMVAGTIVLYGWKHPECHWDGRLYLQLEKCYRLFAKYKWCRALKHERMNEVVKEALHYSFFMMMALPLLMLPATWSRAAFVGIGACALWIFAGRYKRYRWAIWGTLAVLAVVLYFVKRGSADGRALIWLSSLTSWQHHMWLGVGVGGFRHACAEGMTELWRTNPDLGFFASAGVTDYAYNTVVKIVVEQGLIGAVLWMAIAIAAMWRLYFRSRALFLGMMSLLLFSMFSYPFELLPYRIMVVTVIAWSESDRKSEFCLRVNKIMCTFVCLTLTAFCWFLKGEIATRMEHDKEVRLFAGMQHPAFLKDYYELLPSEADNPLYLFDFAKTLREEKRYEDSNAILRMGTLVSADPMFYIIMGNNYRDEGLYDLAADAYEKAYAVMPNRLYPLYLQMMMYANLGDGTKAHALAVRMKHSYVKVESKATGQMRAEADSILASSR